jgi:DTW domain-containing protein YfiP
MPRIEIATKISLVIHHRELSRSSNTGLLALRALTNSELRVRGEERSAMDLNDLLTPHYRALFLFPAKNALELDRELIAQDSRPIQLIVPDGTWRQASKVYDRQPELKPVQRVKISSPQKAPFALRRQHRPEGMATLQAIAQALGVIEGDHIRDQLLKLYFTKLERALLGRGLDTKAVFNGDRELACG